MADPRRKHGFIAAALLVLALTGCNRPDVDPRTQPPLVRVTTSTHAHDPSRKFTGVIVAREQSDLGFRVSGKVIARLVDVGEVVRRGQPLMRIDPNDLALASQASEDAIRSARARAVQTAADERRYRDLVGAGAVSASAYDQAKAAADSARAALSAAQSQAQLARNGVGYSVLRADFDGTVVETLAEPGQVVASGQTVVRLAGSGPREASIQLPETIRLTLGAKASIRTFAGETGQAWLRQISDAADPVTRTFAARFVLEGAPARAPIGSTVSVGITLPGKNAGMVVPLGAIRDVGKGPGVWVISAGKPMTVTWRPVSISNIGAETATITSGLKMGERFVTMGAHMLHQGQPVRIAAPSPAGLE